MTSDLAGRLEVVSLRDTLTDRRMYGTFLQRSGGVFVDDAPSGLTGQNCVARFTLPGRSREGTEIGTFITSEIPEEFKVI